MIIIIVSTVPWSWQVCDYFNALKITLEKTRMAASHLVFAFASSLLVIANGQQKVRNWGSFQIFTLEPGSAGQPSFHRRRRETDPGSQMCRRIPQHWGGGESMTMIQKVESFLKVTWRMNCSEAHTKEMVLSKVNVEISKLIAFEACSMKWNVYDEGPSQSSEVGTWPQNPKVRKYFFSKRN